jgi:hypothetical protein
MRFFISTVRVLAIVVYCLFGSAACTVAMIFLWSVVAGFVPFTGVLAHGGVSSPSFTILALVLTAILAVIGCDIYFRLSGRYTAGHDNGA